MWTIYPLLCGKIRRLKNSKSFARYKWYIKKLIIQYPCNEAFVKIWSLDSNIFPGSAYFKNSREIIVLEKRKSTGSWLANLRVHGERSRTRCYPAWIYRPVVLFILDYTTLFKYKCNVEKYRVIIGRASPGAVISVQITFLFRVTRGPCVYRNRKRYLCRVTCTYAKALGEACDLWSTLLMLHACSC